MAEWVMAEVRLSRKPKVLRIARACGRNRREVAMILLEFWGWAAEQSVDGVIPGLAIADLIHTVEETDEPFWLAVVQVGWLEVHPDRLVIPRADRWITKGAKARNLKNERQGRWRDGDDENDVDASVDARPSTEASTKGKERKGNKRKKKSPQPPEGDVRDVPIPSELDTTEFRAAWDEWQAHLRDKRKPLKPRNAAKQLRKLAASGAACAFATVEYSIMQNYQGLVAPPLNRTHSGEMGRQKSDTAEARIAAAAERMQQKGGLFP